MNHLVFPPKSGAVEAEFVMEVTDKTRADVKVKEAKINLGLICRNMCHNLIRNSRTMQKLVVPWTGDLFLFSEL